jgi:5'-nucleotidase / UDP-sugar diphosphatase
MVVDPVIAALAALSENVLAMSEVPLNGVRADVRTRETNQGNLMADAMLWQATQVAGVFGVPVPDVALQNGGGIRNNNVIPAGPVTELDTFSMAPFANFVSLVPDIPREQFKLILENAVSRVEFGDGRFAQVAGFSFTWDAAQPAGSRVVDAMLDDGTVLIAGGAVLPGAPLSIATIDFLAQGGDQYPYAGAPFTTLGVTYQQGLENYLVDGLGGVITATDYPVGGEGRITRLN